MKFLMMKIGGISKLTPRQIQTKSESDYLFIISVSGPGYHLFESLSNLSVSDINAL